jgi:mono/diheme cytochrome c family protein
MSPTSGPKRLLATAARRPILSGIAVLFLVFVLIQFVPYGRDRSVGASTGEPQWATARTRELMVDACFSCHSNETEYPVYASIAPISWMIQDHIDEGRSKVNYSNFATDPGDADETIEVLQEGEMPPASYTRFGLHPEAKLSEAELRELIDGLRATPGLSEGG